MEHSIALKDQAIWKYKNPDICESLETHTTSEILMLSFDEWQELYLLKPGVDYWAALHPEQFNVPLRENENRREEEPAGLDIEAWAKLPRENLLAGSFNGQNLHRVALTADAGFGKTYNLSWLRHELNNMSRLAFTLSIKDLDSPADLIPKLLMKEIRDVPGNHHWPPERLKGDLENLRHRGQLVLLFDGLDMANDDNVNALARLMDPASEWGVCRVFVAGRPFDLERHWETLFVGKSWQFVRIAKFDSDLNKDLLGYIGSRNRYDSIPREARNILTIPRVVEYFQQLSPEHLANLRTVADVYWETCGYMLRKALGRDVDVITWRRFLALLGALAFTMYVWPQGYADAQDPGPHLGRISNQDMPNFLDAVLTRMEKAVPRYSEAFFLADLQKLTRLNALVNHGWLDVSVVGGIGEPLLWSNASLQEFFAAYWATRWADDVDSRRLLNWVVDPLTRCNIGFNSFWLYASEMPDEAILGGTTRPPSAWLSAMGHLYQGPVRSSEFIFRSWNRMEKWNPQPFQRFKAEFKGILQGIQGVEKQQIGRDLLSGFIPLVGTHKPCDTGIFVMGADQKDDHARTKLEHYRLHQFCVTNVDYELFDPCHKHYRWWDFEGHHHHPLEKVGSATSPEDRCPVVLVSWYDAWCLARWLGVFEQDGKTYRIMLPTEEQWEYACRAGKLTPFSFQAPHDGLSCTPDICNFNGNNPFPEGVKLSAEAQALCYRQATIPVDDLAPNPWGFFQMHGNVWEWCNNYYNDIDKCERDYRDLLPVLRGGSWLSCGLQCQSDSSYFDDPEFSWNYYGFRLAAIPE